LSYRIKVDKELIEKLRKRMRILYASDDLTDISKTSSGIEGGELEGTGYTKSAVLPSIHKTSTPVSILDEKKTPIIPKRLEIKYLSTPSIAELDETNIAREDILHLRKQNLILSQNNSKLSTNLVELTDKYASLEEKSIAEGKKIREEITKLKEEIKFSNEIRTLRFSLPESLLEEESSEEE